ncbi:MAG: helix-turn-helix domain-containing protein, partial [Nanoarchaeota archaeon]
MLEQGLSTPPQVSRGTKIARTHCYGLLRNLKDKGLVIEQLAGKRKAYLASDPEALLRTLERKKEAVKRILPDLRALHAVQKNKPSIHFYDGFEQVKEIFRQTLSAKEIFAIASTKQFYDLSPDFYRWYQKILHKRQIVFYDILTHASQEEAASVAQEILKGFYDV